MSAQKTFTALTIAFAVFALASLGCNGIFGLSAYEKVDASRGDSGSDAEVPKKTDAGVPKPTDAASPFEWAQWPMPNGAGVGPAPTSYATSNEGTLEVVTDTVTKLVWERKPPGAVLTYVDATKQCLALGSGWRLPTRIELVSLVDYNRSSFIDTTAFPATPAGQFWTTSAVRAPSPGGLWSVDFGSGEVSAKGSSTARYARCVRAP